MKALRSKLFVFPLLLGSLSVAHSAPSNITYKVQDQEESFLVRRIAEFWKDRDYKTVKIQIIDFLEKYPRSSINDSLRGILGDLYLQENDYKNALTTYQQIRSNDVLEKTTLNKMQCLYELNQFSSLIEQGKPYLTKESEEIEARIDEYHFLMAEGFFRTALSEERQEQKIPLLEKAKYHYEKVLNSSFNDPVMFALAEIYRLKEENQKASSFFMELAERHPDRREELLFHAALAQSDFDKNLAIDTFGKVIEKRGIKENDAALNRLILYFQENQFDAVIEHCSEVLGKLEPEQTSTIDYIVGRSYFAKEDYLKASEHLKKYISSTDVNTSELRNTLLMQLNCAQKLKDENLYNETLDHLSIHFPKDSELPQAMFIHAMILKDKGQTKEAEAKLQAIAENYPDFENPEALYLEYALVTFRNENWSKSHAILEKYLQEYPDSEHAQVAWKYFLSTSINLFRLSEESQDVSYDKKAFHSDLAKVLVHEEILTANEKKECIFLRAKIAYELESYQEALSLLEQYLQSYPEDLALGETHLLTALCHHKLGSSPEQFCDHAEKALELNPELNETSSIHIELYNVYLSLSEKAMSATEDNNHGAGNLLRGKAAEHLYQAMQLSDLSIQLENRLWLANYYYGQVVSLPQVFEHDGSLPTQDKMETFDRSLSLFEEILTDGHQTTLIRIDQNKLFLEWEALKYANLLGRNGAISEKLSLLKALIEQQSQARDYNWKLKQETLLELAKTYELMGSKESALETYKFVRANAASSDFISEYANLHALRLEFEMLPTSQKNETSQQVSSMLSHLKDIQIRKTLASEPLHLESALEYAFLRGQIAAEEDKAKNYLFYLERIKEDFNNLDDPMVQSYHKALTENHLDKLTYDAYMKYVDAETLRIQALITGKEGQHTQSMEILDKARETYSHLEKTYPIFYLKTKISKSLKAMESSSVF